MSIPTRSVELGDHPSHEHRLDSLSQALWQEDGEVTIWEITNIPYIFEDAFSPSFGQVILRPAYEQAEARWEFWPNFCRNFSAVKLESCEERRDRMQTRRLALPGPRSFSELKMRSRYITEYEECVSKRDAENAAPDDDHTQSVPGEVIIDNEGRTGLTTAGVVVTIIIAVLVIWTVWEALPKP